MRVIETRRQARDRLVVLLPADPLHGGAAADWWLMTGDTVTAQGSGEEWQAIAAGGGVIQIGLAPSNMVRIDFPHPPIEAAERQRLGIARLAALDRAIADPETLHAVAAPISASTDDVLVAVVANDAMLGWLDWAERHGLRLDHVVPSAMVLPLGEEWRRAAVGGDRLLGRRGCVIPDEASLADVLLEGAADPLDDVAVAQGLARVASDPRPDLRVGRFARRLVVIDRAQWRTIGLIAAAIVLVTALAALVEILKLERATARLDAETLAIAQRVAGPQVTLEGAEAALAAHGARSGVAEPLARLLSRVAGRGDVRIASLSAASGTISASLVAPSANLLDSVVQQLQRDGYRVDAGPKGTTEGHASIDVTIGAFR